MTEEKRMKFACTKLKGHAMIWWDHLQKERVRNGKEKIKSWIKMEKKDERKILTHGLFTNPLSQFPEFEAKLVFSARLYKPVLQAIHAH